VITIAHGFGQRVCAEGVETREQLDFLRSVDCDMVQGFLFGQPVPEDEFVDLVRGTPSGR
jgi:EAL domain-containing protein (putative c-di-GMP-specific phosphodiesterase class I)